MPYNNQRNTTKPVHYPTMMVTGIAGSIALLAAYKFLLKPGMLERRRRENELVADTLLGPLSSAKQQ